MRASHHNPQRGTSFAHLNRKTFQPPKPRSLPRPRPLPKPGSQR
ncbi:hypothetical protein ABT160_30005 [Streptomyces sp. NPDC001941]